MSSEQLSLEFIEQQELNLMISKGKVTKKLIDIETSRNIYNLPLHDETAITIKVIGEE